MSPEPLTESDNPNISWTFLRPFPHHWNNSTHHDYKFKASTAFPITYASFCVQILSKNIDREVCYKYMQILN